MLLSLLLAILAIVAVAAAQTEITDDNILDAVRLWMSNEGNAQTTYGSISEWSLSRVTSLDSVFAGEGPSTRNPFNGDISKWDTSKVTSLASTFSLSDFNGDISKWNTSKVMDMQQSKLTNSSNRLQHTLTFS